MVEHLPSSELNLSEPNTFGDTGFNKRPNELQLQSANIHKALTGFWEMLARVRKQACHCKRRRSQRGSMLALVVVVATLLFVPLIMFFQQGVHTFLYQRQDDSASQCAVMSAAQELSRIVVLAPHWGYVSLSNHPAIGKGTLAPDNEPLPVYGINTILGTARLECLLADNFDDDNMKQLAHVDAEAARSVATALCTELDDAVSPQPKRKHLDMNGNPVFPYKRAITILNELVARNAPKSTPSTITNFALSLGWLRNGSTSSLPVPQPVSLAQLRAADMIGKNYAAFKDIPVGGEDFYFAGLAPHCALVDSREWQAPDRHRICSALKLDVVIKHNTIEPTGENITLKECASAIPGTDADLGAPGSLVLNFPHGYVDGINSIRDCFANSELRRSHIQTARAQGDFPIQNGSRLQPEADQNVGTVADATGRAILDWVRTARCNVHLGCLLETFDSAFPGNKRAGKTLIYTFDRRGNVKLRKLAEGIFQSEIVSDSQMFSVSSAAITTRQGTWFAVVHDQVRTLGQNGGKHAGQILIGQLPSELGQDAKPEELNFDIGNARKSFVEGGLAASIEFSTPQR